METKTSAECEKYFPLTFDEYKEVLKKNANGDTTNNGNSISNKY